MESQRDFDCLDFKLMLTAIVDGAAPPEGRQTAERHALSCPPCLKLLEEAESTDFMLRLSARAEPAELPKGFADRVVAATRTEGDAREHAVRVMRRTPWREGIAWIAAAASLALAVVVWNTQSNEGWRVSRGGTSITPIASPVFSGVRDLTDEDRDRARTVEQNTVRTESLASLLLSLADAIDAIVATDATDRVAFDAIAVRIREQELPARTSLLRMSLPSERRADLHAAEAALLGISAGCLDATRLEELQSNLRSLELAQRLRELARQLPRSFAAA